MSAVRHTTVALAAAAVSVATAVAVAPSAVAVVAPAVDHLTVTVRDSGDPERDGTFEIRCHPTGGNHPDAAAACETLDKQSTWGKNPFAKSESELCTMQYGGPATAHVTGTWGGRPVDADFNRKDGCEISRWDKLTPLLPRTSAPGLRA